MCYVMCKKFVHNITSARMLVLYIAKCLLKLFDKPKSGRTNSSTVTQKTRIMILHTQTRKYKP